ncbi:MAG: alcohol dehydrogenase catalytic domain-containing protein [Acidobacteria bacterium]|nr:alcohol dehydrogenase catalytic domain-containing protein [Acidobacteriota bacterium]
MQALRVENGGLRLRDVSVPKVETSNEALVRVLKSGICNTDLEIARGYAHFQGTIGHEFCGIVERADDAPELIGKRIVGEINVGCGECVFCKSDDARHCPRRTVLGIKGRDGAHAEFLSLPARNLFEVPDEVSNDEAVFVEPLAAAFGITEQIEIFPDTRVAIIGDGKLGNLCAQSLALKSENVFLIGKHAEKLALLSESNVETTLLENAEKLSKTFDVAVEASGAASGFATALSLLKPRGKLVLKSTFQGATNPEMWRVVVDEISVVGSRCGRFAPAIGLLADKKIRVENLVSKEFSLRDAVRAMRRAEAGGVMKVLLAGGN